MGRRDEEPGKTQPLETGSDPEFRRVIADWIVDTMLDPDAEVRGRPRRSVARQIRPDLAPGHRQGESSR